MVLSAEIVGYGLESYLVDFFSVKPVFDIPKYNRLSPILCLDNSRYKRRMLVRGGCDVEQIVPYLTIQDIEIVGELNIIPYRRDHLCYLLGSVRYTEEELKKIEEEVMFVTSKSFETDLYDNTFDFFLWSSVVIMMQGLYINKNNENLVVAYKNFDTPYDFENDIYNKYDAEQINIFTENWRYSPHMSSEEYLNDLTTLYEKLPEKTKLILITGSEVPVTEGKERGRHLVHAEINKISEEFAETHSRVLLLDIRKFVQTNDDLTNNIRHYKNFVYRKAADELMNIIRESERQ